MQRKMWTAQPKEVFDYFWGYSLSCPVSLSGVKRLSIHQTPEIGRAGLKWECCSPQSVQAPPRLLCAMFNGTAKDSFLETRLIICSWSERCCLGSIWTTWWEWFVYLSSVLLFQPFLQWASWSLNTSCKERGPLLNPSFLSPSFNKNAILKITAAKEHTDHLFYFMEFNFISD